MTYPDRTSAERVSVAGLLEKLYDLTETEARVAAFLVTGRTMAEVATELGITLETARTHTKRILDKTGCHRQAELVRKAMRELIAVTKQP